MRFLPSFKCCIGKTGIELDLLSEISSIFTGLHSEIFKWQQPSKQNFYQVFLHFLIWHPSNGVCCISCPSAALIQSYFCNTPNWQWIEDWLFPGFFEVFFVDLNRRLSSNQSSRISWNPLKHYSCNMNIFYLNNGWVRCWICIFYLKNWCNFFYLWVLQYIVLYCMVLYTEESCTKITKNILRCTCWAHGLSRPSLCEVVLLWCPLWVL